MDRQKIFNTVFAHFVEQKVPSCLGGTGTICAYRGEGGKSCAIGYLIPDDLYHPSFEGMSVVSLLRVEDHLREFFQITNLEDLYFLRELQETHDCCLAQGMEVVCSAMKNIARRYGLNWKGAWNGW